MIWRSPEKCWSRPCLYGRLRNFTHNKLDFFFFFPLLLLHRSRSALSQAQGQPVRGASAPARSSVSLEVSTEDRVTLRPVFKPQSERAVSRRTDGGGTDRGAHVSERFSD